MNLPLRLLLSCLTLFASVACKKEGPEGDPGKPQPPITIMVRENRETAIALTNAKVEQHGFASPSPHLYLYGELPNGRTVRIRYYYRSAAAVQANTAPLAEVILYNTARRTSLIAAPIIGSVSNDPAAGTAQGFFHANFPGDMSLTGNFKDIPTK